jgi:uncharacterized protein YqeY
MTQLTERLQTDLVAAMKLRDAARVTVLRTTLAAIANAEAPPIDSAPLYSRPGTTEHSRLHLTAADLNAIIEREIAARHESIADYRSVGATQPAAVLEAEVAVLQTYLA